MRRVRERVPMEECIRRAMIFGLEQKRLSPASCFAPAIWPDARFIAAQGAGAAASRVLTVMKKRGLAMWRVEYRGRKPFAWGWVVRGAPQEATR